MSYKISAYLQVYNDWDILELALRSVAPFIDELVVVDGAYEWMAPYYRQLGKNPERSDDAVYDIIKSSGIPYRAIARLWPTQVEKRMAGYSACTHRYACRLDADEVLFFNERELEKFLTKGGAVGEIEMPTYIAPGWTTAPGPSDTRKLGGLPRQCFLFDSKRITAEIHLNYLWLVLQNLPRAGEKPFPIHAAPVAFNAHLTLWRGTANAARRAEYYMLNYMRQNGVPWIPELRNKPVTDFKELFDLVPPTSFRSIMLASRIFPRLAATECIAHTPLSPAQEATFINCYNEHRDSVAALNRQIVDQGIEFTPRVRLALDLSDQKCTDIVTPDGFLVFEFSDWMRMSKAELYMVIPRKPWQVVMPLEFWQHDNRFVVVRIPPTMPEHQGYVQRQIELYIPQSTPKLVQHFRIRTDRPFPFKAPVARPVEGTKVVKKVTPETAELEERVNYIELQVRKIEAEIRLREARAKLEVFRD
ncbi:MAG TPA: hypothetical protein VK779_10325 [Rhizomicrobium sp.]|nr:hypothetical protein [Rhizomicrobium sp.]